MSKATEKMEPLPRPPTPTEKVRAIARPAHDTYHHMPARQIAEAMALAKKLAPQVSPILAVRVERTGDRMKVEIGDRSAILSRDEARELGALLLQLAR